jgi:peroxiredoxin
MGLVLLIARLGLAAIFVAAAVGKLLDPAGSRDAMVGFGVPASLARPFALMLPLMELAIAALLLPVATAWWGSLGALALLAAFVAAIGVNMARGKAPDCHCFGQLHSEPVGWPTLARNGVFAAVAVTIAVWGRSDPGPSVTGWLGPLSNAERALLVAGVLVVLALVVQGWLLVQLMRQNGRLLLRVEALETGAAAGPAAGAVPAVPRARPSGLPVGAPAPGFALSGIYGEKLTLDALRAPGTPVMLVFADPGCGPCNALMPEIGEWQRRADGPRVVVISRGSIEANRAKGTEHALITVLLQADYEVATAYQVAGTPSAVLVNPDATIGSALAQGPDAIRRLASSTAPAGPRPAPAANGHASQPASTASRVGQPAPEVALPNLDGQPVRLSDLRGRDTLVLFWNPGCGFCQRMLEGLKGWEREAPAGAPQLLVITTGDEAANRAQGLRAPMLLDQGFRVGQTFGATGTPAAVLVDAAGRIASRVVAGADAVLALIGGGPMQQAANGNAHGHGAAPAVPQPGQPAPALTLPDLNGNTVQLSGFRGSQLVMLFWNPQCGFCQRMLDDLKNWEERRPKDAPTLLVVSRGAVEDNRALGLRSTMVLDQEFQAGRTFGANGTPMGVLIDAQGRVASEVVAGAEAVLALARGDAMEINGSQGQ